MGLIFHMKTSLFSKVDARIELFDNCSDVKMFYKVKHNKFYVYCFK